MVEHDHDVEIAVGAVVAAGDRSEQPDFDRIEERDNLAVSMAVDRPAKRSTAASKVAMVERSTFWADPGGRGGLFGLDMD
jgi:hypothetical protein